MQNWLLIQLENDWQMVVPDDDIKPHSNFVFNFPNGEKSAFLSEIDCPCKPSVDFEHKIITHNAFDERA